MKQFVDFVLENEHGDLIDEADEFFNETGPESVLQYIPNIDDMNWFVSGWGVFLVLRKYTSANYLKLSVLPKLARPSFNFFVNNENFTTKHFPIWTSRAFQELAGSITEANSLAK